MRAELKKKSCWERRAELRVGGGEVSVGEGVVALDVGQYDDGGGVLAVAMDSSWLGLCAVSDRLAATDGVPFDMPPPLLPLCGRWRTKYRAELSRY